MDSKKPLILIDKHIPYISGRLEKKAEVRYLDQDQFTPENVAEAAGLVIRTRTLCNRDLLENSKVRFIATATIGTDHIDLPYCESRGIKVANAPGCNAPGVSQYVWSSLMRMGFDPAKDRLGIVGCGNVGGIVKEWADILSVETLVSDPPKGINTPLEELLRTCDAITLHTPLTRTGEHSTYHLIGEKEIALMKPGAILVNASRGPVVDSKALKQAMKEGKIKAVIDTWEGEPEIDRDLLQLVTIATPHIAGYSRQGKERASRMALEATAEYFGITADISGLTGLYETPQSLSGEIITGSYDPFTDDSALRHNPSAFEALRHNYNYREEVK